MVGALDGKNDVKTLGSEVIVIMEGLGDESFTLGKAVGCLDGWNVGTDVVVLGIEVVILLGPMLGADDGLIDSFVVGKLLLLSLGSDDGVASGLMTGAFVGFKVCGTDGIEFGPDVGVYVP